MKYIFTAETNLLPGPTCIAFVYDASEQELVDTFAQRLTELNAGWRWWYTRENDFSDVAAYIDRWEKVLKEIRSRSDGE